MRLFSRVALMKHRGIRDDRSSEAPDSATLHPGYLLKPGNDKKSIMPLSGLEVFFHAINTCAYSAMHQLRYRCRIFGL